MLRLINILLAISTVFAHSAGVFTCTDAPNHGSWSAVNPYSIYLNDTDHASETTSWMAGRNYTVSLVSNNLRIPFKGYVMSGFIGNTTPLFTSSIRTGILTPITPGMAIMTSCPGGVTHTNGLVNKTLVTAKWTTPISGTGTITFHATVVSYHDGFNYKITSVPILEETSGIGITSPSSSPAISPSNTETPTPSKTGTPTPTSTPTGTGTPTPSPTGTPTSTITPTNSLSLGATPSKTPTISKTSSVTSSISHSNSPTPSKTPTGTPTGTPTPTASLSAFSSPSVTPTETPTPSKTASKSPYPLEAQAAIAAASATVLPGYVLNDIIGVFVATLVISCLSMWIYYNPVLREKFITKFLTKRKKLNKGVASWRKEVINKEMNNTKPIILIENPVTNIETK
jgi:hypothetical protein